MKNKVKIKKEEGHVTIAKKDRKGPIGLAAKMLDIMELHFRDDDKPKKAAKSFEELQSQHKKREFGEALTVLSRDVIDKPGLKEYYEKVIKHLSVEPILFEESPFESVLNPGPNKGKIRVEDFDANPNVRLRKVLEKPLEDRTFAEIISDEMQHRPGIIAAQVKTKFQMLKWRARTALGL
jgi:hypothetical protein